MLGKTSGIDSKMLKKDYSSKLIKKEKMGLLNKPMTVGMASGTESAESASSIGDRRKRKKGFSKPKKRDGGRGPHTYSGDKCFKRN
jgi:hypothetical protein